MGLRTLRFGICGNSMWCLAAHKLPGRLARAHVAAQLAMYMCAFQAHVLLHARELRHTSVRLPQGRQIFVDLRDGLLNDERWADQGGTPLANDRFAPERWLTEAGSRTAGWLPFGSGPRMCLGYQTAMQELKACCPACTLHVAVQSVMYPHACAALPDHMPCLQHTRAERYMVACTSLMARGIGRLNVPEVHDRLIIRGFQLFEALDTSC